MNSEQCIAKILVEIGAVGFSADKPVVLKSGIKSPVYVDNRKLSFHPNHWRKVIESFAALIDERQITFDIIAGLETAGIPHSSALGFFLARPSVFVRKKVKDHGTKKMVEGGEVVNKKVLLIEDLVTTGISSLQGVDALRAEKAIVDDCLAIVSYGFPQTVTSFNNKNVRLHTLTTLPIILYQALEMAVISQGDYHKITSFLADPVSF